jgi:uncharacterized iron-regulated membrane protein
VIHPYYPMFLTVAILACVALLLCIASNWVTWRDAVERRRDARTRRARREARQ